MGLFVLTERTTPRLLPAAAVSGFVYWVSCGLRAALLSFYCWGFTPNPTKKTFEKVSFDPSKLFIALANIRSFWEFLRPFFQKGS